MKTLNSGCKQRHSHIHIPLILGPRPPDHPPVGRRTFGGRIGGRDGSPAECRSSVGSGWPLLVKQWAAEKTASMEHRAGWSKWHRVSFLIVIRHQNSAFFFSFFFPPRLPKVRSGQGLLPCQPPASRLFRSESRGPWISWMDTKRRQCKFSRKGSPRNLVEQRV